MSLSGLDSSEVDAAAKALSQERGGWFLLHYVSRDTVKVLSQGTKGINELRDAALSYYADSDAGPGPLFGMIDFRRRKVLVKLVPDDTSRLIKARVQVHWTSVTSRFPSHDSVFETTSPDQLTESRLIAHLELHSGRSSSGSNKKQTLDGISEEGVEDKVSPLQSSKNSVTAHSLDESSQQVSPMSTTDNADHSTRISSLVGSAAATSAALQRSLSHPPDLAPVPELSTISNLDRPADWKEPGRSGSDAQSVVELTDRRMSSQSGRPSTANEYSTSLYEYESPYKPKTKLGPRPATASRPVFKGTSSAALPSGLRATRPGSLRPNSRDSTYSAFKIPPPPPIPESSPLDFMPRPRSSGNSVKSLPATLPKSPGMSREKQRLMKFREMYKEKENKRANKDHVALPKSSTSTESEPIKKSSSSAPNRSHDPAQLPTSVTNPAPEDPTRLSVISESSTGAPNASSLASINPPSSGLDESESVLPSTEMVTGSATPANKDVSSDRLHTGTADSTSDTLDNSKSIDKVTVVAESLATNPASSPVSLMDSSEKTSSTRATSISEPSDDGKTMDLETIPNNAALSSVERNVEEEPESQSSTPTAAPLRDQPDVTPKPGSRDKRRMVIAPIAVPSDATESDTDGEGSYDDDLMDELDDAEVHEAFSMSVSKSPITPYFSRRPSALATSSSPTSAGLGGMTPSPLPSPMPPNALETVKSWSPGAFGIAIPARRQSDLSSKPNEIVRQETRKDAGLEPSKPAGTQHISHAHTPLDARADDSPSIAQSSSETGQVGVSISTQEGKQSDEKPQTTVSGQAETAQSPSISEPPAIKIPTTRSARPMPISTSRISSTTRAINSHDDSPSQSPLALSRSSSATLLSVMPQQHEDNVIIQKRRNLGSGVAAKIADLQRNFSGRSSTNTLPAPPEGSRKSSIASVRAGSIRDNPTRDLTPPHSGSSHVPDDRMMRGRAHSKASLRSFDSKDARTSTPPRQKSSSSVGKLDSKRFTTFNNSALEVTSKVETIQVKATIIRTDLDSQPSGHETRGLGLQNSPLDTTPKLSHVEPHPSYSHPRTSVIVEEPKSPTRTSTDKAQMRHRTRSSISSALGLIGLKPQSPALVPEASTSPVLSEHGRQGSRASVDTGNSWRTIRRRASASLSRSPSVTREIGGSRSPSAQGYISPPPSTPNTNSHPGLGRNMSSSSLESATTATTVDADTDASHKRKGGRASRMLKRMSNSMTSMLGVPGHGGESGQGSAVETVEEEQWVGADLGQLNVQFPDTLLWKRRYLEIDTQGYLVLKPHDSSIITKSGIKNPSIRSTMTYDKKMERRYHLGQFFPPFAPDMERMEMPYSVVLDFKEDGGTLQVAADSSVGQRGVLRVLSEAHRVCTF